MSSHGHCCEGSHEGKRQSPIAIYDAQAVTSPALLPLSFCDKWGVLSTGAAKNNGYGIYYAPEIKDAKFTNHMGTYVLQQFHMHWGQRKGEGSEHTLEGTQYEAEIHFVHLKEGADPQAPKGDSFAVLGVLCQEDSAEQTGAWGNLKFPREYPGELAINGVNYKELVPSNKDYYYYEGSLTTPQYAEVVQWFVLKNPVKIPTAILNECRQIQDRGGQPVVENFRAVQDLHGRVVQKFAV